MLQPSESMAPNPVSHPSLQGLTVLERGWLSSNNVIIHGVADEAGAVLVDTGHRVHGEQTVALVRHALAHGGARRGEPLARIVNTHLHSDHCGGNALLQRNFEVPITIPPGAADAVRQWGTAPISHDDFGQRERFVIDATLAPGESFVAGGRRWEAVAAPGHDPDSVMLFDAGSGLLLSADALWENGFGVIFPELVGESGFDEVASTLEAIERLPVALVVPGHGAPFADVAAALARARARLAGFKSSPERHARHAAKVLLKYHVMEERSLPAAELLRWAAAAPLMRELWDRFGLAERRAGRTLNGWLETLLHELAAAQALGVTADGTAFDR
jgi:glyoxylase-like metal-dependent hydrolase (beta-lactamase superfamily II)